VIIQKTQTHNDCGPDWLSFINLLDYLLVILTRKTHGHNGRKIIGFLYKKH